MTKQLLFALALGITAGASAAEVNFSYNAYDLESYGYGYKNNQVYDIGIALNTPQFIGKQIISFSVPILDTQYVSEVKAWLTKELNASKGNESVFTPDVVSYDAVITDGMLNVTLPEPYTIPEEGIYLGYSLTVSGLAEGATANPVAVADGNIPGGLWVHASSSQSKWADMAKRKQIVSSMVVTISGDFPTNAANISPDTEQIYAAKDETSAATFIIENQGTEAISSFDYEYTVNGNVKSGNYEFETPIPATLGRRASAAIEVMPIAQLGEYAVDIKVTKVNGVDNGIDSDVVTIPMTVQPFVATYRPLVEEYTALRCGFCPRGYVMLEQMKMFHGDKFVAMSFHCGDMESDAMVYIANEDFPVYSSGLPYATFNRGTTMDPSSIPDAWANNIDTNTPAEVTVDMGWTDETMTKLTATAHVRFIKDIPESDYLLSFALVADGLSNDKWVQSNYYNEYEPTGVYSGPFWDLFVGKEDHIEGLIFNDIVVYYPDTKGVEGSLPETIEAEKWYDCTFEVDINDVKNLNGNNYVKDFNKTRVVAMIVNGKNGKPINCISSDYPDGKYPFESSVETIDTEDDSVIETVYYDLQGRRVSNTAKGLCIRVERLSDGSVKTSKVIL